jgi:hypothetical protein
MESIASPDDRPAPAWAVWVVGVLLVGYLTLGRSFAHLGFAPLYVAEVALLALVLARPGLFARWWLAPLVQPSLLSGVAWAVLVFGSYGTLQVLRGFTTPGLNSRIAAQCVVFNIYPIFFFVGCWAGTHHPDTLPRLLRLVAWAVGLYGVLFVLVLNRWEVPEEEIWSTEVRIFGQPSGGGVALLGILAFEPDLWRAWPLLVLNGFVFIALQMRALWLGFLACLPLWGLLANRLGQLVKLTAVVCLVLLVAALIDIRIPSPLTRGLKSEFSVRDLVARALAPISHEAAAQLSPAADDYENTFSWRTEWWRVIWRETHENDSRALFGLGYGYPLWELHPDMDLGDVQLRTPHSSFYFALGYTGWVGVVLFAVVQLTLLGLAWRAYGQTGQPFGLCCWVLYNVAAIGDTCFDTPHGAVPYYLLMGLSVSSLLAPLQPERPVAQALQVAAGPPNEGTFPGRVVEASGGKENG